MRGSVSSLAQIDTSSRAQETSLGYHQFMSNQDSLLHSNPTSLRDSLFTSVSSLAIVFCIQPTPNSVTILTMVKSAFTAKGFSLVPKRIMMVRREYNAAFGWGYDPCNHKYKVERIVNRSGEIEGVHPRTVIGSASN
ncbi:hypothetical protein H0E87_002718 [Populus deltoides]|uniref:Uncharacterized protein n=1 Tax=Populus deltoides TaxID=3696 RepID=A0A8T2ZWR9_POPDE|nr:hypothetical protein H0E87_002718 [Populus deltoides]